MKITVPFLTILISLNCFAVDSGNDPNAKNICNVVLGANSQIRPTPVQVEGPFYPGYQNFANRGNDLTNGMRAFGETIVIEGRVLDKTGQPVVGAEVHLWQTDGKAGKYKHPADPEQHLVDPEFNSWGSFVTDQNGYYRFRTVRPIAYPAGENWMRPDHLHFMVLVAKKQMLITQSYFIGDQWLSQDLILQALSPADQALLLVDLKKQPIVWSAVEGSKDVLAGTFDMVLSQ